MHCIGAKLIACKLASSQGYRVLDMTLFVLFTCSSCAYGHKGVVYPVMVIISNKLHIFLHKIIDENVIHHCDTSLTYTLSSKWRVRCLKRGLRPQFYKIKILLIKFCFDKAQEKH